MGTVISRESVGTPSVSLKWDDPDDDRTVGATTALGATLRNLSSASLSFSVTLTAFGIDARKREVDLGTYTLGAASSRGLSVTLDSLPVQSVGTPSQVVLTASHVSAPTMRAASTPMSYEFTDTTYASVVLRGKHAAPFTTTITSLADFLDPSQTWNRAAQGATGRATNASGVLTDVEYLTLMSGDGSMQGKSVAVNSGPFDPDVPPGTGTECCGYRICTTWAADFVDSGYGEDAMTFATPHNYPAAYTSFSLYDITTGTLAKDIWGHATQGFLDEDGCVNQVAVPDPDHLFELYQTTVVEHGLTVDVILASEAHVNTFFTPSDFVQTTTIVLTPPILDERTRIAAVAGQALKTHDASLGSKTVTVHAHVECPDGLGGSCTTDEAGNLHIYFWEDGAGQSDSLWKVVVAHELGHVYQTALTGLPKHANKDNPPTLCSCTHVTPALGQGHCMQSRHPASLPMLEAFAHWYAATTFNDPTDSDCAFAYYKEFLETPGNIPANVKSPPYLIDCKAATTWMEAAGLGNCAQAGDGVELDWMQFFWDTTKSHVYATTTADLQDIFLDACGGTCNENDALVYADLDGAAQADLSALKYTHFNTSANAHGVNH